jgi:hypothetical protein
VSVDLRDIVERIGAGEVRAGGREAFVPSPGHSRRDRGLHLTLTPEGRVLWKSFNGDDANHAAVFAYLGIERAEGAKMDRRELDRLKRHREAERRKIEAEAFDFCKLVWDGSGPIEGTPAESYLYSRGLIFENCPTLRWHPAAPRSKPKPRGGDEPPAPAPHPGMVAIVSDASGAPKALHVTYITPAGTKAFGDRSRLMFGFAAGSAVRLSGVPQDGRLGIAEGIETAGAFSVLHGLPTWAALSTSGMQNYAVPPWVRRLVIAADSDDATGAGLAAARALAERASHSCDVEIRPAPKGQDWNDVLQAAA